MLRRFRRSARERLFQTMKRSEEHTSELQSQSNLVCRLLLEKKKKKKKKKHENKKDMIKKKRIKEEVNSISNIEEILYNVLNVSDMYEVYNVQVVCSVRLSSI